MNNAEADIVQITEARAARAQLQQALNETALALGLRMLSMRLLTVIALVLDAGIFAWAMASDTWPRAVCAVAFAVASWCVVHLRLEKESRNEA
jgi:FtsH-binding integral membrane protein